VAKTKKRQAKYPFNDWSEPPAELDEFKEEIQEAILQKYGADQDGDCPVHFQLVDRTKYQFSHYQPVPYTHAAKTQEDFRQIYNVLSINLATALRDMDNFVAHTHDRLGMLLFAAKYQKDSAGDSIVE
jgi:hypothetical protein